MSHPTFEDVRRLAEWEPPLGVLSVYLQLDPADRGGAWRTSLRNGLAAVRERRDGLDHDGQAALQATVKRVEERFANHERQLPRGEVGFVEVASRPGAESWWPTHLMPNSTEPVSFSERPLVAPLLHLVERCAPCGVALLSAERVRLLERAPGHLEELESWELSVFSRDWRERKTQRVPDPARAQAVSASGRDQFDERLGESRRRFLGECGRLAAAAAAERSWPRLLVFGSGDHLADFRHGVPANGLSLELAGDADLISDPVGKLEAPVAAALQRIDAERDRELVERALGEAHGGTHGATGPQETGAALDEGRADRLVFDAGRAADPERLIRAALATGAGLSAVEGEAAELLEPAGGVAALLRY